MHSEQSFHILTSIKIGNITKSILFYFNMIRLNELEKSIRWPRPLKKIKNNQGAI